MQLSRKFSSFHFVQFELNVIGMLHYFSVWTYLPRDAPNFHNGNSLNLGTGCLVFTLTIVEALYIRWENDKRERGERDYRCDGKTAEVAGTDGSIVFTCVPLFEHVVSMPWTPQMRSTIQTMFASGEILNRTMTLFT